MQQPAPHMPKPRRPWIRLAITLAIGLFFVRVVLKQTTWHGVGGRLASTDWPMVVGAFAIYYSAYLFRGLRLWLVARRGIALDRCTAASLLFQILVNYMPVGLGNIALPAILSRYAGVETASGTKMLIALKLLDATVVCGVACIAGLTAAHLGPVFRWLSLFAGICASIGIFGLLWPHLGSRAAGALWRAVPKRRSSKLGDWVESVLTITDPGSFRRRLPGLICASLAFGLTRVTASWALLNGLGVSISILQAGYLWAFVSFAAALPFQPPGGLGLKDAISMALLLTVGQAMASAAEVVVINRAITVPLDTVMALLAWLYLSRASRAAQTAPVGEA